MLRRMLRTVKRNTGLGALRRLMSLMGAALIIGPTMGCMLGPDFQTPEAPVAELWREAGQQGLTRQPVEQADWWRQFNDPVLDRLIEQAIANNNDLDRAALNIVQARTSRVIGLLTYFPFVKGGASAAHVNFSETVKPNIEVNIPELGPIAQAVLAKAPKIEVSTSDNLDMYSAGLDAIWELDLWGVRRRDNESIRAQLQAAFAGYDDVLVSVIAEVAVNYIEIRAADKRIESMRQVADLQRNFLKVTEERYAKGESPETDVLLAQTLTGMSDAAVPALENVRRVSENALCILLGTTPQDLSAQLGATAALPTPPASIAMGIPADLLRRRPDIRMAEHLAHAQCAQIGMAKADILPSFSLIGSIGYSSTDSDRLFDRESIGGAYGGAVSITRLINYPLFVQRVRKENVAFEQALIAYEQAVLTAAQEAENAMYGYLKSREQADILRPAVAAARRASELAVGAYQQGQVIVSVPLVALSILAGQEDRVIAQDATAAMQVVALNKALGGGWEWRQGEQLVPEATAERLKDRSEWRSFGGRWMLDTRRDKSGSGTAAPITTSTPVGVRSIEPGSNVQQLTD